MVFDGVDGSPMTQDPDGHRKTRSVLHAETVVECESSVLGFGSQ